MRFVSAHRPEELKYPHIRLIALNLRPFHGLCPQWYYAISGKPLLTQLAGIATIAVFDKIASLPPRKYNGFEVF